MEWADIVSQLDGQIKQKLAALDRLQGYVQSNAVSKDQVSGLLDVSSQLLADNNFKVALKLLNCWECVAAGNRDEMRPYTSALLPHVVERLGDNRQDVRQAACNLLLELLQVLRPEVMMDRLGRFWGHKHWKVRHGLLQFVAEAVATMGEAALAPPPREERDWVVHKAIQLVGDPESAVRDAAVECIEEVYRVYGEQLVDVISSHKLRPAHLNLIYSRLAALGADVSAAAAAAPAASASAASGRSGAGGAATASASVAPAAQLDEYDTACSGGGGAEDDGYYYDQQQQEEEEEEEVEEEGEAEEPLPAAAAVGRGPGRSAVGGSCSNAHSSLGAMAARLAAEDSAAALDVGGGVRSWGGTAPAAAAKPKRGGYRDGGGISSDGALPAATPLLVSCERDLRVELDRVSATLSRGAAAMDWEKRVAALVRLEGLVKGGAAGAFEACFMEHLRGLRDALTEQLVDRRSAVARQAAHLMEVLAAALGHRFDPFAAPFMSALFKVLVITVQVVSEAADAAARGILVHCHAPRLVPCVCDVLVGDRSAKLRQHCSAFLLQILEDWDPSEYCRHVDAVEAALTAAVQDALGETRTAGRAAFAAYAAALPDRAGALLRRMDSGLQQKLHEAIGQYSRGATATRGVVGPALQPPARGTARSAPPSRAAAAPADSDAGSMGPPPAKPPRSGRMGGTYQRAAMPAASYAAAPADAVPAGRPPASRKSVAGVPMRVPGPASSLGAGGEPAFAAAEAGGPLARRRTSVAPQRVLYHPDSPPRAAAQAAGGYGARSASLAGEASKVTSLPGSPDSCAHSEASAGGSSGGGGGGGHYGAAARLFQQPKMAAGPHHHQLYAAALQHPHLAPQPGSGGGGLSRTASASDDLQLLAALRDQQQQQLQYASAAAAAAVAAGAPPPYQEHQQAALGAQASSASVLSMAATLAAAGAGLAGVQQPAKPATLARAVAAVLANPKDWKDRVERMNGLAEALARQAEAGAPAESYLELDKVLTRLLAAVDDPHFKVSLAALAALQACLNTAPAVMEPAADRLMPVLFLKLCAAKQAVRSAAEASLQACALRLDADALLPGLVRSLDAMKQPAARVSVMEFCVLFLGEGKVAGVPSSASHLRQWITRNIPLLLDKNPNVRSMSAKALGTMYSIDPASVAACLQHASPQEVAAVQRSLALAEARAAAEEADEAAAAVVAAAGEPLPGGWQGPWGTSGGAVSAASSIDLSTATSGAYEQQQQQQQQQQYYHLQHQQQQQLAAGVGELSLDDGAGGYGAPGATLPAADGAGRHAASHLHHHPHQQPHDQFALQQPQAHHQHHHEHQLPPALQHQQLQRQQPQPHQQQPAAGLQYAHQHHHQQQHVAAAEVGAGSVGSSPRTGHGARDVLGRPMHGSPLHSSGGGAAGGASAPGEAAAPPTPEAAVGAASAAAAAAAQGDAGSQARHLTVLVHRLQSRPGEDVLAELAACAGKLCRQAWRENFSKVLLAALSAASHGHEPVRELAFTLVLCLARHQADLFEPLLDVVVQPLLQGCADESREVLMAAQQALDVIVRSMPPLRCAGILAHKLPSEEATASGTAVDGEVLCATVRCLQSVCRRMAPAELLSVAPALLLPGLVAAFQHARPDVRKAVTFCLVDMWRAAGEGLTPHLSALSTSQLKLLTIYYNRAQASS